jgi:ATP-dependent Zn protease
MGRQMGQGGDSWGPKIVEECDLEISRLVNNAYRTAKTVLSKNITLLEALKDKLLEQEQVSAEELSMLISSHEGIVMVSHACKTEPTNLYSVVCFYCSSLGECAA